MKVHIYQGELDNGVLPAAASYMAERLPSCELHWYPGQGHLGASVNGAEDVIRMLAADEAPDRNDVASHA